MTSCELTDLLLADLDLPDFLIRQPKGNAMTKDAAGDMLKEGLEATTGAKVVDVVGEALSENTSPEITLVMLAQALEKMDAEIATLEAKKLLRKELRKKIKQMAGRA